MGIALVSRPTKGETTQSKVCETATGGAPNAHSDSLMQRPDKSMSLPQSPLTPPAGAPAAGGLSVLVVEPVLDDLIPLVSTLSRAGFRVTAAASFAQATPLLNLGTPAILMAAVRLGVYNGLHLVLRGKAIRPTLAALVFAPDTDPVLRADAEAMGATFVVKPIDERELIAAVAQTYFRRDRVGPPIRAPFERRVADRRAGIHPSFPERRVVERRQDFRLLLSGCPFANGREEVPASQ